MYKILRFFLSFLSAERALKVILACISFMGRFRFMHPLTRFFYKKTDPSLERTVFGIKFSNPVGMAAGIDNNGKYSRHFSDMGFAFLEIGSVTPLAQKGNPLPRLFMLPKDKAVISRMGFNNDGIKAVIENLKKTHPTAVIAANISKNSISEGDKIVKDYGYCFSMLYDFVDMFIVNISCSFTDGKQPDLSYLSEIIDEMLETRMTLDQYKPVLLKISPDIGHSQVDEILNYALLSGIDGIVAGGSTLGREGLNIKPEKLERIGEGRMSGAPLFKKNLELVKYIHTQTKGRLPIIGCGGIMTPKDAAQMLEAGASLVEICSGFIYNGPSLVKKINKYLISHNA